MLTTPCHLLGFHVFGNGFHEELLDCFPRDWGNIDQPVIPQTFLPALLKTGVSFTFLQSSGTSLGHRDLSKIIKSGPAAILASSLSTRRCILSGPLGLWTSSLFKGLLAWSSCSEGKSSSLQTSPLVSVLPVKTEVEKMFSTSAFSMSSVTRSPAPFSHGPTFSLVFFLLLIHLEKPFLLSFKSLARFNSTWSLALLTHPCMLRLCPCSSWAIHPCFHLLWASLLAFEFRQELLAHPCRPLLCGSCSYSRRHYSVPMWCMADKYYALIMLDHFCYYLYFLSIAFSSPVCSYWYFS